MLLKQKKQIEMLRLDGIADLQSIARWYCKFFKHGCLKFPSIFLISEKKSIWPFLYKKDHIIKKYFSRIRLSYLTTENLSTFTESILQNLEETS